ncbi:Penicillin-binding protein 1F [Roseovarius albus]|uniref:peptidoglycan glycosyltransferase n=1 Tax=Roseovarius albus TaxID=1247867 RepID=A0A1X6YUH6_9RHOB|nr:penicillin-binding protein 1C [Roseovarius albus]SLN31006.1 Penicillin-binding protein 1F [Roseovarius albus]
MSRRAMITLGLIVVLCVSIAGKLWLARWIESTELPPVLSETSTEIRDRNGALLRAYTVEDGRWRFGVAVDQVDSTYVDMLIAYEDQRFYTHSGVDFLALARATWQALLNGQVISGGSTLTMQVARLLENGGTGRWPGKLRQMRVAWALEQQYNKDQILQMYLTHAPYGGNLEGVRAATLAWFGKEPQRLTLAESALLVALPQSPATRRPDQSPKLAQAARNRVLERMASDTILPEEATQSAQSEPLPHQRRAFPALAPHMADKARSANPTLSRINLTFEAKLQQKLETLAQAALRNVPAEASIAIVMADHQTGEILASVGSAGYDNTNRRNGYVDMANAVRSPGSTLKPFIYAMAFDRGLAHPQTLIDDRPVSFGQYAPQNFDGQYRGQLPVADALRLSLNIPAVALLDQIGPAHLMDLMRRSGVQARLPGDHAGLAIGLGGVGVTLTDLVQLYAMLANQGQTRPLVWQPDQNRHASTEVLSRSAAWQVGDILAGLSPPSGVQQGRLAYKTGTSYGHRDVWAIGFDGAHVAGVWVGRPDGTPLPGAFGGDLAAPILFDAFQRLKSKPDPLPTPPPETLLLSSAELPAPLRRFASRNAPFEPAPDAPKVIFPPNGAQLRLEAGELPVKLRDGAPPFVWMANGIPVLRNQHRRDASLPALSAGFSEITVIDAKGRAARVTVRLD